MIQDPQPAPNLTKSNHRLRAAFQAVRLYYVPAIAIGLCYLAITMMWTLYAAYVPVFLDADFGLRAAAIGVVMMLDNLSSLFIQPWIGARSDRLRARLGRRLPIILAAMPFAALGFVFIPVAAQVLGSLLGFVAVVMVMLIGMSAIRVPLFALMPDFTAPERRSTANGIINLFGGLGTLIAALGLGALYRINRGGPFWFAAGTLVVTVLILVVVIRKVAGDSLSNAGPTDGAADSLPSNALSLLRDLVVENWRGIPLLLAAVFFYTFGFNAVETFFILYGRSTFGIREEQALAILGVFFLSYLVASVPAGIAGERRGRLKAMIVGLVAIAVLIGLGYWLATIPLLFLFMPVGGVVWALVNSNALPAIVGTVDPARSGSAVGLYYFATTLASIASPVVNGGLIEASGDNYKLIMLTTSAAAAAAVVCLLALRVRNSATQTDLASGSAQEPAS
jgi:Na+/melibiose symporter-like transporter